MSLAYFTYWHKPRLPQALCLIESIRRFDQESQIVAVVEDDCFRESLEAVDEEAWLMQMSQAEVECRKLGLDWGSVRGARSERDIAWTFQACYPYMTLWSLTHEDTDVTYVDSDVYFFQDLRPYIDCLPETAHVALCPHHYPPGRENKSAGVYNNGLMWWRNSDKAREIAKAWGQEAIARFEPHEQILLDAWPERYGEAVAEFGPECDWGPWRRNKVVGSPPMLDGVPLQSAHMHEWRPDSSGNNPVAINGRINNRTNYPLESETIQAIYRPYEEALSAFL